MKDYRVALNQKAEATYDSGLRNYMMRVYNYMGLALLFTATVAYLVSNSPQILGIIFGTPLFYVVAFAPFLVVMTISFNFTRMATSTAQLLFWLYAGLMGLSLSSIFIVYTGESIVTAFLSSAAIFGSASLYGYTTKKDLSSMGAYLFMAVIGLIVASLLNMFFQNSQMSFVISLIAVVVFTGLAAYDNQRIKHMYDMAATHEGALRFAIFGALSLYIDFINIFLSLLRLMGDRRD